MKVLVTRQIPQAGLDLLRDAGFSLQVWKKPQPPKPQELETLVKGKAAILSLLSDKIDAKIMDHAGKNLKIIANYAVGYDNIDVAAASARGIFVTNTPGVLTDATAELAWTLLFSAAKNASQAEADLRRGQFRGWTPQGYLGVDVLGKTLGIIGAGRIGQAMAKMSRGFNMRVLYFSRSAKPELESEIGARLVDLPTLLKESDFVSVHLPLSAATRHLLGKKEFALMKKTAVLINTGRGPVIDEKALAQALKKKQIFAAWLDVYEKEPQIESALLKLPNATLLPHIGSATFSTRAKMATVAAQNIIEALKGSIPADCLNRQELASCSI